MGKTLNPLWFLVKDQAHVKCGYAGTLQTVSNPFGSVNTGCLMVKTLGQRGYSRLKA